MKFIKKKIPISTNNVELHNMKRLATIIVSILFLIDVGAQSVSLSADDTTLQTRYALTRLKNGLTKKGHSIQPVSGDYSIDLNISTALAPESFIITHSGNKIRIKAGDSRGLIYGSLSILEDLGNGIPLRKITSKSGKAFLPFRAIKFDLPWDTYRHSYALDLHDQTCRDTVYWRAFLDMMAEDRFNTLTLWNLHPYTFLIKPRNFPEASPWTEAEMKSWQELFHAIMRMAHERAIDVYLVPFNIFVTPEFAKSHGVALDNLAHDYFVKGDTAGIIKRYTRECVTQVLQEYPDLTGFGLTLGEGMGGMTPQQREDWMRETIIEGMRLAGRKSKLIHRIPFSSTTGSLGITSIETEKLTRKAMEEEGKMEFMDGPIWADLKFNWSHAHSTTKLIKVHGGKLYHTYFTPLASSYKIVWTVRNEDFFCLRWGVPDFVRSHILKNKSAYSGGYILGSETYIPAKDCFTLDSLHRPTQYAFERQWLFYKLWGRLLYQPTTPDELFSSEFIRRYGAAGKNLLQASALASSTALRIASDFDCGWDFTLYTEGMMSLDTATKRVGYISVEKLMRQPTLDSDYVSVADYGRRKSRGIGFKKREITPPMLADKLETDCSRALYLLPAETIGDRALVYELADIRVWSYLGLHFAEKVRGAFELENYRSGGGEVHKQNAVIHLKKALAYWDSLIAVTKPLYREMPLVHLSQQGGKESRESYYLNFHWAMLRGEVARDVELAREFKR